MNIGIFGGSFNPIHVGHVALAQAVLAQCRLDEVWLMVSPQNPLKQDSTLLDDRRRYVLAQKALEGISGVTASDYEFRLPKPSYTWSTLQHLANDYPWHRFSLIVGGDNWAHFERWRHWQDILRHHDLIVYPRNGHPGTIDVPLIDISSTEIRRRISCGEDITGMVPEGIRRAVVEEYSLSQYH